MTGSESDDELVELAVGRALAFLARRDRTRREVSFHLERRGFEREITGRALGRLSEMGYLDDARFAESFARIRSERDGWGDDRIRTRLSELGVPRGEVEAALEGLSGGSEVERALALLERRITEPIRGEGERRRAMGILVRRGYSPETAADAIRAHNTPAD